MSENFFNLEKKPDENKNNNNMLFVIVPAVILILVFGIVIVSEHSGKEFFASTSDKVTSEIGDIFSSKNDNEEKESEEDKEPKEDEESKEDSLTTIPEITTEKDLYTVTAQKGEGLTHLARKALTTYMNDENINLTNEERIYIEDYVQKEIQKKEGKSTVDLGDEIEISTDLLDDAIDSANNLTPTQINNLTQYSVHVSF